MKNKKDMSPTDYHKFTTVNTPKSKRRKLDVGDIWLNQATCKKCEDTIISNNRHDFKSCKCGTISIDGGSWYARRLAKDLSDIESNIVYYKDVNHSDKQHI